MNLVEIQKLDQVVKDIRYAVIWVKSFKTIRIIYGVANSKDIAAMGGPNLPDGWYALYHDGQVDLSAEELHTFGIMVRFFEGTDPKYQEIRTHPWAILGLPSTD